MKHAGKYKVIALSFVHLSVVDDALSEAPTVGILYLKTASRASPPRDTVLLGHGRSPEGKLSSKLYIARVKGC